MKTSSHFLDGTRDLLLLAFVALVIGWWVFIHRPTQDDAFLTSDALVTSGDTP